MPRPRRTKVASNAARLVTSSEDAPTSNASKLSKADSVAPLKSTRGGAAKFKSNRETEEIESSGQRPQKKQVRKSARKPAKQTKKSALDMMVDGDDDEVDEVQTSAVDMLRARMSVGASKAGHRTNSASTWTSLECGSVERRKTSLASNTRPRSRVDSTPHARQSSIARGRTPSVQPNTDDDLYGLSPAGKASQARIAPWRSSVPRAPMSALRVQGTPGMETSVLALQNFKRRPRQPSLIRMVQQSSELGREDEDALLGPDSELDDTLRDFDNFLPQDESTPLNFGKKKHDIDSTAELLFAEANEPRTPNSRKRKRTGTEEEVQIPGSSPYGSSPPHIEGTTWARATASSSLPEERVIASTEEQDPVYADPLSQSDTQAPPRSSSEPASPKRQKTRGKQSAPTTAKPTRQNMKKKATKMSTAHLQSLLPKPKLKPSARHAGPTATYDVLSDSELDTTFDLPEDNDELSRPTGRRRATTTRPAKTPLTKKDANKKSSKNITPAKAKQKRVYGCQKSVEKENDESVFVRSDDDEEDTIDISRDEKTARAKAGKSKELERARKMFAAVDEWEMEFESVDLGGGESSPWR